MSANSGPRYLSPFQVGTRQRGQRTPRCDGHPLRRVKSTSAWTTICTHGRTRPGLDHSLAAVCAGDTLVATKFGRLERSVPDARDIADRLMECEVGLGLGVTVYDPADSMGKIFFFMLATFAEFEGDLIRMRTQ